MKVDSKLLADHLHIVGMKGRITEASFGPDFAVEMVDENTEVVVKGKSPKVSFPDSFAVMDLSDFARLIDSFSGEVNLDIKDGKAVIGSPIGVVSYQTADPSTVRSTIKNFADLITKFKNEVQAVVKVSNSFPSDYARFQRLISPDLVELGMKDGKIAATLMSMKGHRAEIFVGSPMQPVDKVKFKLSAHALTDVVSSLVTTQSHEIVMTVGKALILQLDLDYTFAISPQAE